MGVNLKNGYNGELTSKQAGSVGGQMVKKICPVQRAEFVRESRTSKAHRFVASYQFGLIP